MLAVASERLLRAEVSSCDSPLFNPLINTLARYFYFLFLLHVKEKTCIMSESASSLTSSGVRSQLFDHFSGGLLFFAGEVQMEIMRS